MKLKDLKLGVRLGLGFAVVLALMATMAVFGAMRLHEIERLNHRVDDAAARHALVERWRGNTALNLHRTLALAKATNAPELAELLQPQMKATTAEIDRLKAEIEQRVEDEREKADLAKIAASRKAYIEVRNEVLNALKSGHAEGPQMVVQRLMPASEAYFGAIEAFTEDLERARTEATSALDRRAEQSLLWLSAMALAGVLTGAWVSWAITRSVTRPMRRAIAAGREIAGGDLSQTLQSSRRDELGELERTLGEVQTQLRGIVAGIRQSTESIATASSEVAVGSEDLSVRTEQAAASIQQTAASMEEITATVKNSADAARQANALADSASAVAGRGGAAVSQVVTTMEGIHGASRKIADIIGVIDGIAFQTNILALNAAVEAARAGEQGRGFAVVAGEVRTLAQRSASAAKEIKGLIADSVGQVDSGLQLVQDAGATMGEIVASVQRVTDTLGHIALAASEQNDGIAQVNVAVAQLDQMTQQNAALVEESAAAAESLKAQAAQLRQAVAIFKLAD